MSGTFFNLIYNKDDYCHTVAMWTAQLASAPWLEGCVTARGRWVQCWPFPCGLHMFFLLLLRHRPKTGSCFMPQDSRDRPLHPCGPGETLIQNGWMELIENIYSKVSAPPVVLTVEPGNYHLRSTVFPKCKKWEILKKLFSALISSAAGLFNLESPIIQKTPCSV